MPTTADVLPSKEGPRVGYLNINHAYNKLDDIGNMLDNSSKPFHIFCFSESRLRECMPDSDLLIPGYNIIRRDAVQTKETGLLLYYTQSITIRRIVKLERFLESVWVEIKLKHIRPSLIGFIYRNPSERIDWFDSFSLMMDAATLCKQIEGCCVCWGTRFPFVLYLQPTLCYVPNEFRITKERIP